MLPYASYLRVYEPFQALHSDLRRALTVRGKALADISATLAAEQRTVLTRAVTASTITEEPARPADVYVLRREGRTYFCPVDMPLRSWLSMTSLIDSIGGAAATAIMPPESLALADERFLRWRRDNPAAVPHIQQVTWGVPRAWFALVVEDERTGYDAGSVVSVRYRARMEDALRRIAAARRILVDVFDDSEVVNEVASVEGWLASFHAGSWVEVDYAGVAQLLGEHLTDDRSAREIHQALDAIQRGDLATAGATYRAFEERWRRVNAFERAN